MCQSLWPCAAKHILRTTQSGDTHRTGARQTSTRSFAPVYPPARLVCSQFARCFVRAQAPQTPAVFARPASTVKANGPNGPSNHWTRRVARRVCVRKEPPSRVSKVKARKKRRRVKEGRQLLLGTRGCPKSRRAETEPTLDRDNETITTRRCDFGSIHQTSGACRRCLQGKTAGAPKKDAKHEGETRSSKAKQNKNTTEQRNTRLGRVNGETDSGRFQIWKQLLPDLEADRFVC